MRPGKGLPEGLEHEGPSLTGQARQEPQEEEGTLRPRGHPPAPASGQPTGVGRCGVGDVQTTDITPAEPESPDRNNAPFCPGGDRGHCVRTLQPEMRPSERQDCLGQPLWPGAAVLNVTTNPEQAKGQPLSQDRAPSRLQASQPHRARVEKGRGNFGTNWIIQS